MKRLGTNLNFYPPPAVAPAKPLRATSSTFDLTTAVRVARCSSSRICLAPPPPTCSWRVLLLMFDLAAGSTTRRPATPCGGDGEHGHLPLVCTCNESRESLLRYQTPAAIRLQVLASGVCVCPTQSPRFLSPTLDSSLPAACPLIPWKKIIFEGGEGILHAHNTGNYCNNALCMRMYVCMYTCGRERERGVTAKSYGGISPRMRVLERNPNHEVV